MVWRSYDVNNTYVIDDWQRVQTFEEFETKAMMLRDDKFHEERLEIARKIMQRFTYQKKNTIKNSKKE